MQRESIDALDTGPRRKIKGVGRADFTRTQCYRCKDVVPKANMSRKRNNIGYCWICPQCLPKWNWTIPTRKAPDAPTQISDGPTQK